MAELLPRDFRRARLSQAIRKQTRISKTHRCRERTRLKRCYNATSRSQNSPEKRISYLTENMSMSLFKQNHIIHRRIPIPHTQPQPSLTNPAERASPTQQDHPRSVHHQRAQTQPPLSHTNIARLHHDHPTEPRVKSRTLASPFRCHSAPAEPSPSAKFSRVSAFWARAVSSRPHLYSNPRFAPSKEFPESNALRESIHRQHDAAQGLLNRPHDE